MPINTNIPANSPKGAIYTEILAASATFSAALVFTLNNPGFCTTAMTIYWNILSFPASASTTAQIALYAVDPATGATIAVNTPGGGGRSAVGCQRYVVTPYAPTVGNSQTQQPVGMQYSLQISLSTGATVKKMTHSLYVEWQ